MNKFVFIILGLIIGCSTVQFGVPQENLLNTNEYLEAQKLIGKTIYRLHSDETSLGSPVYQKMITTQEGILVDAPINQQLKVIGVDIVRYGHAYYSPYNFHLKVINNKGEEGLFPYEPSIFTLDNLQVKYTKSYGNYYANQILKQNVVIGMTQEMVILSWGKPEKINRYGDSYSVTEQWIYPSRYLYFTDGILKSFQEIN